MSFLGGSRREEPKPTVSVQVGEEQPHDFYLGQNKHSTSSNGSQWTRNIVDVGIFKDTLAPNLILHGGLAAIAYGVGRATNRVEAKDWLWPAAPVINAWWSAVGRRVYNGMSVSHAFSSLSWVERLLLTGVTLWGTRLFYRIAQRSLRRGKDDPRYEEAKKQDGFWNQALITTYLPEVLAQTIISLPFTAPFRHQGAVLSGYHPLLQALSVGLFSTGFALETIADAQLDAHQRADSEGGLVREGVWSICRHPNYLGDALVHLSFPLLLYSSDMLAPIELLGPVANYLYLRYVGGDAQTESYQTRRYSESDPVKKGHLERYREQKNSFWPDASALQNQWTWVVAGAGVLGVVLERTFRAVHHS